MVIWQHRRESVETLLDLSSPEQLGGAEVFCGLWRVVGGYAAVTQKLKAESRKPKTENAEKPINRKTETEHSENRIEILRTRREPRTGHGPSCVPARGS